METPRLPYFAELKDGILVLLIYKLQKNNCFIGFPKLVPTTKNNTQRLIKKYSRAATYDSWFKKPWSEVKKYIEYIPAFDAKLFCFPCEKIARIFHPLNFKKIINKTHKQSRHFKDTITLTNLIAKKLNIPLKNIGAEGSTLLSTFNKNSDIDLLIYGSTNARKLAENFHKLNKKPIRFLNTQNYTSMLEKRRLSGYGTTQTAILTQETRRFYGFINNRRFSIISVLGDKERELINLERTIKFIRIFKGIVTITDATYTNVIPSVLYGQDADNNTYRIELLDHYAINQARRGEKFFIRGKLYEDIETNEKIIILAFWDGIRHSFSLID